MDTRLRVWRARSYANDGVTGPCVALVFRRIIRTPDTLQAAVDTHCIDEVELVHWTTAKNEGNFRVLPPETCVEESNAREAQVRGMYVSNCADDDVTRIEAVGGTRRPEMQSPLIPEVSDHFNWHAIALDRHDVRQADIGIGIIRAHTAALTHAQMIASRNTIPVVFGRKRHSTLDACELRHRW